MMKVGHQIRLVYTSLFLSVALVSAAQEGGPPMLTDDARVTDYKEWEINTSVNTSVTNNLLLSIPHVDLNYGILPRLQLKAEAPFLLDFKNKQASATIGDIIVGVKYRFLDEARYFISAATFPQVSVRGETGYLLPVFIEKTMGRILIGQGIGYFIGDNHPNSIEYGSLIGFRATDDLHLMIEYFVEKSYAFKEMSAGHKSFLNAGIRYPLSKNITLMGSAGSQISGTTGMEREKFISWLGIQTRL